MSPFNVSNFRNSFKLDVSRIHSFIVTVSQPLALSPSGTSEFLSLRGFSTNIPERSLETIQSNSNYFQAEEVPISTRFNDFQISFYVTADLKERIYFENWLRLVQSDTGEDTSSNSNISYLDDIVAPVIKIHRYGMHSGENRTVDINIFRAYPVSISETLLDWGGFDTPETITVSFKYRGYNIRPSALKSTTPSIQSIEPIEIDSIPNDFEDPSEVILGS